MMTLVSRFTVQSPISAITALAGLVALVATEVAGPPAGNLHGVALDCVFAAILIFSIVLAYNFPIRVRNETKVYMNSVPLLMIVALLPISLALPSIVLGKLIGELSVQSKTGTYLSDVATQVGRWTLVGLIGVIVAHAWTGPPVTHPVLLFGAAFILWFGDVATCPLLFCPVTKESPWTVMQSVVREAGPPEGAQYVFGILGTVAAAQARWTVPLLFVPTALMYLAFKHAKDVREAARVLLANVVDAAQEAILVLDSAGKIVVANRHAASLYACATSQDVVGRSLIEAVIPEDRARTTRDMQMLFDGGDLPAGEYSMLRADGETFVAQLAWTPMRDRNGQLTSVSVIARDVTEWKKAEEALAYRAMHDALTGLPNRVLFRDRLEQALLAGRRSDLPFGVLLIDLNRFKQVNDTYGHKYGDELLRQVAQRMRTVLRESDTIARLGGDEFGVLLPKVGAQGSQVAANRLLESLTAPFAIEAEVLDIGASIGCAVFPDHGTDIDLLIERADLAMYAIKRTLGGYHLWAPDKDTYASPLVSTTR